MIGRCWPSVTKLYESHENRENSRVAFVNVKSKYCINEDLIVNYSLREEFKSSSRDWIGILPRGWSNLQQYLTFEYTLPSPTAQNPQDRTIIFPRIFHREASLNLEYQFVYVSREIQIMAVGSYFRFTPALILNNEIQQISCPSLSNGCPRIESRPKKFENSSNNDLFTVNNGHRLLPTKQTENANFEICGQKNIVGLPRQTCRYCHRKICGLKIDALRGDFLAALSDSLLDRVRRLERDLSLAESNLKNAKNARENIAKRLRAYEAFVTEMLSSVDARGIVQITDEKGNEILLQRVYENDDSAVENTRSNDSEEEIIALKSLVEKQEQIIAQLMAEQRNFYIPRREKMKCIDREIQTISDYSQESKLTDKPDKDNEEKLDDHDGNVPSNIVKPKNDENSNEISNVPIATGNAKCPTEGKNNISSKYVTEHRLLKIQKPTGMLVQGKNVKFAIVRL